MVFHRSEINRVNQGTECEIAVERSLYVCKGFS